MSSPSTPVFDYGFVSADSHVTEPPDCYLDEDGFLFNTDRNASVIISGGVNIYPAEVEAILLQHPAVKDAAVIGIANPEWGEEVKAVVQVEKMPAQCRPGQRTPPG